MDQYPLALELLNVLLWQLEGAHMRSLVFLKIFRQMTNFIFSMIHSLTALAVAITPLSAWSQNSSTPNEPSGYVLHHPKVQKKYQGSESAELLPIAQFKTEYINPTTGLRESKETLYVVTNTESEYRIAKKWATEILKKSHELGEKPTLTLLNVAETPEDAQQNLIEAPLSDAPDSWGLPEPEKQVQRVSFIKTYWDGFMEWFTWAANEDRDTLKKLKLDAINAIQDKMQKSETERQLHRKVAAHGAFGVLSKFYRGVVESLYSKKIGNTPAYKATFAFIRWVGVGGAVGYATHMIVANSELSAITVGLAVGLIGLLNSSFSGGIQLFGSQYLAWFKKPWIFTDWLITKPAKAIARVFFSTDHKNPTKAQIEKEKRLQEFEKSIHQSLAYDLANSHLKYIGTELPALMIPIVILSVLGVVLYPGFAPDLATQMPSEVWAELKTAMQGLFDSMIAVHPAIASTPALDTTQPLTPAWNRLDVIYDKLLYWLDYYTYIVPQVAGSAIKAWFSQGLFDIATSEDMRAKAESIRKDLTKGLLTETEAQEALHRLDFRSNFKIFAISVLSNFAVVLGIPEGQDNRELSNRIIELMGWSGAAFSFYAYREKFAEFIQKYIFKYDLNARKAWVDHVHGVDYSSCSNALKF
jgi:hypothetical protein